jgi:hypothetical protein
MSDDVRILTVDLDTRIGRYPTGTVVLLISQGVEHTSICLDSGGWHPNRRCHTYTLPHRMISGGGP